MIQHLRHVTLEFNWSQNMVIITLSLCIVPPPEYVLDRGRLDSSSCGLVTAPCSLRQEAHEIPKIQTKKDTKFFFFFYQDLKCLACNGIRQKVKIIIDKLRRGALHDAR
jgi:hypothetical protein